MSRWSKAEHGAVQHYRRALAAGSDTDYAAAEWELMVAWFGRKCLGCGGMPVTVDHVVPLSAGGSNSLPNLQPLCRRCNSSKGQDLRDYRDIDGLVTFLAMVWR